MQRNTEKTKIKHISSLMTFILSGVDGSTCRGCGVCGCPDTSHPDMVSLHSASLRSIKMSNTNLPTERDVGVARIDRWIEDFNEPRVDNPNPMVAPIPCGFTSLQHHINELYDTQQLMVEMLQELKLAQESMAGEVNQIRTILEFQSGMDSMVRDIWNWFETLGCFSTPP